MYEITVLSHFAGAHRLRALHGRCESLHGHNWKIEVSVAAKRLTRGGIVLDFGLLKQAVERVLADLDHTFLNELPCFARREPSSENIARVLFQRLKVELRGQPVKLTKVSAWESETAGASYSER